MNLYIDTEFNEFGGDLISMGIVSAAEDIFYRVLPCENPKEWVKQHVMPVLNAEPISIIQFQLELSEFLNQFHSIHVVADWPDDIKYFCQALITAPGYRLNTPHLTMEIVRIDTISKIPHNALYDAFAIMEYFEKYPAIASYEMEKKI